MAKNICPTCSEVILSLEDELSIKCYKCDTVFELSNELEDDSSKDVEKEGGK